MTELQLAHLSGRWDRSPRLLKKGIAASADEVDVITLTEVADDERPDALPRRGWTVLQDRSPWQSGEVAILVRDAMWDVVHWRTHTIYPDLGPGLPGVAIVAVLKHKRSGVRLIVSTSHLPASVEGGFVRRTRRAVAHQRGVQKWRRIVRAAYRDHRADAIVVTADWNLDLHRKWVRAWIRGAWPGLRVPRIIPTSGTHGRRLIDWILTKGVSGAAFRVRPATEASDHRPIRVTGTIRSTP